jgi:DNA polymerase-1
MDKIYVIDAVNILFRSYYAIKGMTNPQGEATNALYGFIRSIYKLINDYSPNFLVAVFDGPDNKKSRTDIYEHYKSHRKGMPDDLVPQLEKALKFCELAGIPYLSIPGVEADDTMGTVAKWGEMRGSAVFLCTSDKDLCQLVSDHTFVINLHKDNLLIDRAKVKELFGVTPEQIVDLLAIMGDASDNIPGLEGFGAKTAASLLQEFGSLDNLLAHPEKVPGQKKQEILAKGKEIALMSRQLATIHTHVDIPRQEDFFHLKEPELEPLIAFYQQNHFLSLLREIDVPKAETKDTLYTLVDDEKALTDLIDLLIAHKEICIDTETTDVRPMRARLVGIGFSTQPKKAWYVPLNGSLGKEKVLSLLKPLFQHPDVRFCGHHLKYDMHVLLNEGLEIKEVAFDTILASYLLKPQAQRHNLDELSLEYFGAVKIPIEDLIGKGAKQITMDQVPIEKVCTYCCEDVDFTCRLKGLFQKELEKRNLISVFEEIELPLIPVLMKMERCGIYVDVHKLKKMSGTLTEHIKALESDIHHIAGESFNLNSPKQLSSILFEKMGIKPPKKTATGYSTSADVLESLQESSPIVRKILDYRTLEKLRSTYVDSLPDQILPATGRIHCTFNQSVAATGRLSCQDPNLQNIPIRSEEGRKIREAFKPSQEGWSFVSGDYSQVELRILAHLSEDPSLIRAFQEGEDVHAYTASLVFNVPLKEVTPEMRHQAKAVNFGIVYGQQAYGLSQGLGIDIKEAATFIETYFQRYKKVKDFLEFCKESVRKTGCAYTLTGRQRPIPDMDSKNPMVRAAAERLAINTPLQGTAADLIKIAMIRVDEWLQERKDLGMMILQIHDELLFEVPDAHVPKLSHAVQEIMEGVFDLKVPLSVQISIGKNWGEC